MELVSHHIDYHMAGSASGEDESILRCDCLPERTRWSYMYLARSGLPVARSLGIESLIHKQCNLFFNFLVVLGENTH